MADEMENEFMQRGYLLPKGCKNLSDAWKKSFPSAMSPQVHVSRPLPLIIGEKSVPSQMSVAELAEKVRQKPYRIVADLMEMGVFAMVSQKVGFEVISAVLRKYGYMAKKAE